MERIEWLNLIKNQSEELYDHIAPQYWETFGFYPNSMHIHYIEKLLSRLRSQSYVLDAACGAGRYDGMLYKAGHMVVGIDQSSRMLSRAREHFTLEKFSRLSYLNLSLQEMDFRAEFDGAICVDAMEHIFPEDWPGIVSRFQKGLKPGGFFYATVEVLEADEVSKSYERARAMGLPVVYGELADTIDAAHAQIMALDWHDITGELAGLAAYHYYPSNEQVCEWYGQAGLVIEEEGMGDGYAHFLARKEG